MGNDCRPPALWDESVVLSAEVGKHIVITRRSGDRWHVVAMNGDDALTLEVPLAFLGADARTITLRLAPGCG